MLPTVRATPGVRRESHVNGKRARPASESPPVPSPPCGHDKAPELWHIFSGKGGRADGAAAFWSAADAGAAHDVDIVIDDAFQLRAGGWRL